MTSGGTSLETLYGRGFAFPMQLDAAGGWATQGSETVEDALELVAQSIFQIVLTSLGTRAMLRGFGGSLYSLVLAPKTDADRNILAHRLSGQIGRWEKRVRQPIRVAIRDLAPKRIGIVVAFTLVSQQVRGNIVIPVALDDSGQLRLGPTSEWSRVEVSS